MGRSRGGLTTKIHALVDARGLPIMLKLTEGQAHDGRSAEDMLGTVRAGTVLLADRAYDLNALRKRLDDRGAWGNIRAMPHRLDPQNSANASTESAIWSRGSSINSNSSVPSPPVTTNGTTTISPP